MYKDAKKALAAKRYSSVSELIRDALRRTLYAETTENEFTKEFENYILKSSHEPEKEDFVFKTEKELENYFNSGQ